MHITVYLTHYPVGCYDRAWWRYEKWAEPRKNLKKVQNWMTHEEINEVDSKNFEKFGLQKSDIKLRF